MSEKFRLLYPEDLYPTPQMRVESPQESFFHPGDVVRMEVGPATGKIGIVVVERNGNYLDSEPYRNDEAIGVSVAEEAPEVHPVLKEVIDKLTQGQTNVRTVVRWFDNPEQLTLLQTESKTE